MEMTALSDRHQKQKEEFDDKLIDYESMKISFDSLSDQLKESEQALSSLQIQLETTKQTNELNADSMKRQFKREMDDLDRTIAKIQDEAKDQHSKPMPMTMGPLYDSNESETNPYLSTDFNSSIHGASKQPMTDSKLDDYLQELESKANDDQLSFAKSVESAPPLFVSHTSNAI